MGKWSKYGKKYKKEWENEADLREWLIAVEGDITKAACRFCNSRLRAHHSDLMSHAETVKHKRNSGQGGVVKREKRKPGGKKAVKKALTNLKEEPVTVTAFLGTKDGIENKRTLFRSKICHDEVVNPASLGFIGCGTIAQALLSTFLKEGLVDPHLTIASAPTDRNLCKLRAQGVRTTHDNSEVVKNSDLVFICVKPQVLTEVVEDLMPLEDVHSPLFVSVVTGVSLVTLEELLGTVVDCPRVVRCMTNNPSAVGQGCCLFTRGTYTSPSDADVMHSMLGSLGLCAEISEHHMDAASGLVCSGPAFIYTAIEAMADGGVKMGLPRHLAQQLAAQTVKGSAAMVLEGDKHPGQLKDEVCSPGGTTITALHTLERLSFRNTIISAVETSTTLTMSIDGKE